LIILIRFISLLEILSLFELTGISVLLLVIIEVIITIVIFMILLLIVVFIPSVIIGVRIVVVAIIIIFIVLVIIIIFVRLLKLFIILQLFKLIFILIIRFLPIFAFALFWTFPAKTKILFQSFKFNLLFCWLLSALGKLIYYKHFSLKFVEFLIIFMLFLNLNVVFFRVF